MKLTYTNDKFTVDLEAEKMQGLFDQVANFQEVFENQTCGKCGKTNIRCCVRVSGKYTYREMKCLDCGAKLAFGTNETSEQMFPKNYRLDEGKDGPKRYLPDNGWGKYNKETEREE